MVTDTLKLHCFTFTMLNRLFLKKNSYTYPTSFVKILAGTEIYSFEAAWIN